MYIFLIAWVPNELLSVLINIGDSVVEYAYDVT